MDRSATEMDRTQPKTIDDLPELPFELVLSYLSLGDVLKSRAVSRGWYHRINCFKVKRICCSDVPNSSTRIKSRLVSGAFAQNFIGSLQLETFIATFAPTILIDLKHLRLYVVKLNAKVVPAILNSFGRLQQLDIIRSFYESSGSSSNDFELNLPMLRGIHLEMVFGVDKPKLTLNAPRLRAIKLLNCSDLHLVLIHSESVERLLIDRWQSVAVKNLNNLQHLCVKGKTKIDSTFLSSLELLREVDLEVPEDIRELFEQKQRYGRDNLKIYRFGCLLNGPDDPLISSARFPDFSAAFVYLAENRTRLADEFPLCEELCYDQIERVATESAVSLLKKFIDLKRIVANQPIQNVERLLDLLKNFPNIIGLDFDGDQPQELFDRLPECLQQLCIGHAPSDHRFLFKLRRLVRLILAYPVDTELVRKLFEELPNLFSFEFVYLNNWVRMQLGHLMRFLVMLDDGETGFDDLDGAIQFIVENVMERESEDEENEEEDEEEDEENM